MTRDQFNADSSLALLTRASTPPVESTMTVWAIIGLLLVVLTAIAAGGPP
jgi:hypothetical protein